MQSVGLENEVAVRVFPAKGCNAVSFRHLVDTYMRYISKLAVLLLALSEIAPLHLLRLRPKHGFLRDVSSRLSLWPSRALAHPSEKRRFHRQ